MNLALWTLQVLLALTFVAAGSGKLVGSAQMVALTKRTIGNVTRLEVPGSPLVGWVRVVVTPGATPSFAFEQRLVPRWKYW